MRKLTTLALAAIASLAITGAHAQIAVDLSQARVSIHGTQTLKLENLAIQGMGTYQVNLRWNPVTLSFEPVVESLIANGAYCEKVLATGNVNNPNNKDGYDLRQRTVGGITSGAITGISKDQYHFIASWAKTDSMESNPYLIGNTIQNFDKTRAYGTVGYADAYSPISAGAVVEVHGNFASGVFNFREVNSERVATFIFPPASASTTANCAATTSGLYSGNPLSIANKNGYQITILDSASGSVASAVTGGLLVFSAISDGTQS